MKFEEIEHIFNRSLKQSFSKKKALLLLPPLFICGLMLVFCRALSVNAGKWMVLSFSFLPVFLSSGILLTVGVVISRLYYHEVKMIPLKLKKILSESFELLIGASYLTFPLLLAYLFLWMLMGIFYLLTEIPKMGEFLGVILAFGPFLLVLTLLALSLFNLFIFFFVSPHIAINPKLRLKLPIEVFHNFNKNIFSNLILFLIGITPLCIVVGILSWAAFMTGLNFFVKREALSVALQWFFIMIPFCVILTPAILFFFNFSVESYVLIKKKNSITT